MNNFVQWNTGGLKTKWPELKGEILKSTPVLAALQETRFRDSDQGFRIPGYTWHTNNVNGQTRRGGAAILIANSVPHHRVTLNTTLNCVAVRLKIDHTHVTALSIYIPPANTNPTPLELDNLIRQLPSPLLLMGDVNAQHPAWGGDSSDTRGNIIEKFISDHNLIVLNTGEGTRLNLRGPDRAIDLTCCTNTIYHLFDWAIASNPGPSDHYKITITLSPGSIQHTKTYSPSWNLKRADWTKFEETVDLALEASQSASPDISLILRAISSAAQSSVPKSKSPRKKASAPWWTPACSRAVAQRTRALKKYKRCVCEAHRLEYIQAAAHCKQVFNSERTDSWRSFASKFNRFTPSGKIWKLLKAFHLKRPPPGPFPSLKVNGQEITDPELVMNTFAQHYATVSANNTFSETLKKRLENLANSCDFTSQNNEIYNKPFTIHELTLAISKCGQTSVGPDDIHYEFFRHLSGNALTYLLAAINDLFQNHTFPASWRESIIIPIPKPDKDKKHPKGYRPISLTSCASKVTERMVNTRLKHYLESQDLLDEHQCGFRQGKSTTDNIIRLITDTRTGFYSKKTTLAVFLDIKAAFDRVQKPALIYRLYKIGLRGHLAHFIINFLTDRTFRVRCGTTHSPTTSQDQGLPQGSVLSPTLFLIMINDMCKVAKQSVNYSLFADDVAIWTTKQDHLKAEESIQAGLNSIASFCTEWGFTLSTEKSATIAFTRSPAATINTRLFLNGQMIEEVKDFKFLGVHLDRNLTFAKHLKNIKNKCAKRTNILRALAGTDWGGDRKTILQLYTAIIRPIIEYCSIAYHGGLTESQNRQIEAIQNSCIRIATGALFSTRNTALLAEANMPTCQERRIQQLCRYAIHVNSIPNHPVQQCLKPPRRASMQKRAASRHPPLCKQLSESLSKLQLVIPKTAPRPKLKPFWLRSPPQIEFLFSENKADITPTEILARFNEFKAQHFDKTFMYTDGSKQEDKVGFALATAHLEFSRRLPDKVSIFTAEAFALYAAVQTCVRKKLSNIVICSDSKSVLQALKNVYDPSHNIISSTQKSIPDDQNISFLWIPGHANIPGNERADKLAKQALDLPEPLDIKIPVDDCKAILQQHMQQLRQQTWDEIGPQHLHDIKPKLGFWASAKQNSRQKEVSLTRLRTGRTRLNAPWLEIQQLNICAFCNTNTEPTVKHILLECSQFNLHRRHITAYCRQENVPLNLSQLLGDRQPELLKLLFQYLRDTKLAGAL